MRKLVLLLFLLPAAAGAEDPKKSPDDAMIEMYVEMARPVAEHERLRDFAGRWEVTAKLWFDPAGAPRVATGSGVGRLILGGRFLQLETSVKGGGVDSEALTLLGFDRRTGHYTMIAMDTLGTYYITAAGRRDDAAKAIVMDGSYAQPPTGEEQKYRFVLRQPSAGEQVWDLYFSTADGKKQLVSQTILKRFK